MLGWKILPDGDYKIGLPSLSEQEQKLIEALEEKFKIETREKHIFSSDESQKLLALLLNRYAAENKIYLDQDQFSYINNIAHLHIYGLGFIDILLKDNEIEEISVFGLNKPAYVYIKKIGWQKVNACFTEENALTDIINKMARQLGRRITLQNPRLDAILPDGSRLHASLPPISGGELTIRKFKEVPFSPVELEDNSTISSEALAFLSMLMPHDASVIICGNTASGKTTTLNALFSFIPFNERIVITEETPEINIPHFHQVRLVANKDMGITLKDLVYDSLRMRPDRMIVGEVRNQPEAEALFDVLLGGQSRGSYATFHAQSSREAARRLLSFGINPIDLKSIDAIIVQRRMLRYDRKKRRTFEIRRVIEIAEINEHGEPDLLFIYNPGKDRLERKKSKNNISLAIAENLEINENELEQEIKKRKMMLEKSPREFSRFFRFFQGEIYGMV